MEETVLQSLMNNEIYFSKAFTHLDKELFQSPENNIIFEVIQDYVSQHSTKPNYKEIGLTIKESNKINKTLKVSTIEKFKEIAMDKPIDNVDFIIQKTEQWVQKLKLTKSIFTAADIIQADEPFEPIVNMVTEALQISFDTDKGLEYQSSIQERAEYYHKRLKGISTGIPGLDTVLGGGYMKKTLNIIGSVSHGGKSALMAAQAANMTLAGKNVLYITLEMSEEETAKRIDANILDIDINELKNTPIDVISSKFNSVKDKLGNLIIKEYAAGTLNTLMIEGLLSELAIDGYVPDIIFIDYLGLMASSRITLSSAGGSYGYIKAIAEECHGLSKKIDMPIVTASQLNRGAYGNVDAGLESVSDSIGLVQTADTFCFLINSDTMKENNQVLLKFEKNRNTGQLNSLMLEVDYAHMRYMDFDDGGMNNTMSQQELNTMLPEAMAGEGLDFGSINF